jgi:hypothetical protein
MEGLMSSKKCPNCGLYNMESAIRCDCGYDFASGQIEDSYLRNAKSPTGIRSIRERRVTAILAALGIGFITGITSGFILVGVIGASDESAVFLPLFILIIELLLSIIISIIAQFIKKARMRGIIGLLIGAIGGGFLGLLLLGIVGGQKGIITALGVLIFNILIGYLTGRIVQSIIGN